MQLQLICSNSIALVHRCWHVRAARQAFHCRCAGVSAVPTPVETVSVSAPGSVSAPVSVSAPGSVAENKPSKERQRSAGRASRAELSYAALGRHGDQQPRWHAWPGHVPVPELTASRPPPESMASIDPAGVELSTCDFLGGPMAAKPQGQSKESVPRRANDDQSARGGARVRDRGPECQSSGVFVCSARAI